MRVSTIALAACLICQTVVAGDKDGSATQPSALPTTVPAVVAVHAAIPATEPTTQPITVAAGKNVLSNKPSTQPIAIAADKNRTTAKPATRPADIALSAFDKATQKAAAEKELALSAAAKQYKTDLQKALAAAMDAANLGEANRDKAEIDRVDGGKNIDDGPKTSAGSIFAARKKYDLAVKKADEVLARENKNASRKCVVQLDVALAASLKAKDLDEANRIKSIEDRLAKEQPPIAPKTRTIDLLALVDPLRDAEIGNWQMASGTLVVMPGDASRLLLPYRPPAEFDLCIELSRIDSKFGSLVVFPHAGKTIWWSFSRDGSHLDPLPAGRADSHFQVESGQTYSLRIEVRSNKVRLFADDKLKLDYNTDYSEFNDHPEIVLAKPRIQLEDWWSTVQYKKVEVIERSGPGTYFPPDAPGTHDIPEKAIRESKPDAADAMPIPK